MKTTPASKSASAQITKGKASYRGAGQRQPEIVTVNRIDGNRADITRSTGEWMRVDLDRLAPLESNSVVGSQRGGDFAKPLFKTHADFLDSAGMGVGAHPKITNGGGNFFERLRNGVGAFFVGVGKVVQGGDEVFVAGHRVGDITTYRLPYQRKQRRGRITGFDGDDVRLSTGDVVPLQLTQAGRTA